MSSYLLQSEPKELQRYLYTDEETEAQSAEGAARSPSNGSVHHGTMSTIYLAFVCGEGTDESFILSYTYLKKLRHLCP